MIYYLGGLADTPDARLLVHWQDKKADCQRRGDTWLNLDPPMGYAGVCIPKVPVVKDVPAEDSWFGGGGAINWWLVGGVAVALIAASELLRGRRA